MQFLVVLESQLCKDLLCFLGGEGMTITRRQKSNFNIPLTHKGNPVEWSNQRGSWFHCPLYHCSSVDHLALYPHMQNANTSAYYFLQYNPIPLGKKASKDLKKNITTLYTLPYKVKFHQETNF